MKSINALSLLPALLHLDLISGTNGAKCSDLFVEAYPGVSAGFACEAFGGDPTLHGVLYACNSLNQEVEAPANVVSQSFNEKCEADVGGGTKFTCYQFTTDVDFTAFENAVAATTITCKEGDAFDSPKYMFLQTTAGYTEGGGRGSQETKVPHVVDSFDSSLAANAFYVVTVAEGDGMTPNPALVPGPAPDGNAAPSPAEGGDAPAEEGTADDSSSGSAGGGGAVDVAGDNSSGSLGFCSIEILLAAACGVLFFVV